MRCRITQSEDGGLQYLLLFPSIDTHGAFQTNEISILTVGLHRLRPNIIRKSLNKVTPIDVPNTKESGKQMPAVEPNRRCSTDMSPLGTAMQLNPLTIGNATNPFTAFPSLDTKEALRILVVDDSKLNRKVIVKLMESLSHNCVEAADGKAAVDLIRDSVQNEYPFDLILMDNQMPVLLGSEATRIIRSELKFEGIIFGVTGNVLQADIDHFFESGVDDIILKPLTTDKFVFCLKNAKVKRKYFKSSHNYRRSKEQKLNELTGQISCGDMPLRRTQSDFDRHRSVERKLSRKLNPEEDSSLNRGRDRAISDIVV